MRTRFVQVHASTLGRVPVRVACMLLAVAALAVAPAAGAAERSHATSDCPLPPHAAVAHIGLAHALPAEAAVRPAAPAPSGTAECNGPRTPTSADTTSSVRARAPPLRAAP